MMTCESCGGSLAPGVSGHVPVGITSEYGLHAHVDEGIARLVLACWDVGIVTGGSCQGGGSQHASLGFAPGSAESFARAATIARNLHEIEQIPDGSLDWRIYEFRDFEDPEGWRWIPGYPWGPGFSCHFPPSDIPELVRRLESFR